MWYIRLIYTYDICYIYMMYIILHDTWCMIFDVWYVIFDLKEICTYLMYLYFYIQHIHVTYILYIYVNMFVLNIISICGTREDYTSFGRLHQLGLSIGVNWVKVALSWFLGAPGMRKNGLRLMQGLGRWWNVEKRWMDAPHPNRSKKLNSLRPNDFRKQKIYPIYQHLKLFCLLWTNFLPNVRQALT